MEYPHRNRQHLHAHVSADDALDAMRRDPGLLIDALRGHVDVRRIHSGVRCPFHVTEHPLETPARMERHGNGVWRFRCRAQKCNGLSEDIFGVEARLTGRDVRDVMRDYRRLHGGAKWSSGSPPAAKTPSFFETHALLAGLGRDDGPAAPPVIEPCDPAPGKQGQPKSGNWVKFDGKEVRVFDSHADWLAFYRALPGKTVLDHSPGYADRDTGEMRWLKLRVEPGWNNEDKSFVVAHVGGDGRVYGCKQPNRLEPLYLNKAARALVASGGGEYVVTEGEKKADALNEIEVAACSTPFGADARGGKLARVDLSMLYGGKSVLWPDCDAPNDDGVRGGEAFMAAMAGHLAARGTAVRLIDPSEQTGATPTGYDVADFIRENSRGDVKAMVEAVIRNARAFVPITEPPATEAGNPTAPRGTDEAGRDRSVAAALSHDRWTPMPLQGFPEPIREYILGEASAVCVDPSVIGIAMLSASGTAVGNSRVIRLKRGWDAPAIIWGMIVDHSGAGKSLAFKAGMRFGREHAADQGDAHRDAMERWRQAAREAKENKQDPPAQPVRPRFDVNDVTREALVQRLLQHRRGLVRAVDEVASVFNFNEYRKTGSDEQFYLSAYDASPYINDRIGSVERDAENEVVLDRPFVSIVGGIQWAKLAKAFSTERQDSGLAARFLLAAPPEQRWRYVDSDTSEATLAECRGIFDRLFAMVPPQPDRYDRPGVVTLSEAACGVFAAWAEDEVNAGQAAALTVGERTAWPKLRESAGRIALVLHCMHVAHGTPGVDPATVDERTMRAAVDMARWFAGQARQVYSQLGAAAERPARRQMSQIDEDLAWLEQQARPATPSEFCRRFGRKKDADGPRRLEALEAAGRIKVGKGRRGERGPEADLIEIVRPECPPGRRAA